MKKYKLIKIFPGSPDLGTIIEDTGHGTYKMNNSYYYGKTNIENYPDFWEEIIEVTEYVECIYVGYGNERDYTKGKIYPIIEGLENTYNNWSIFSVKRLSDGVEFKISDSVQFKSGKYKITKFRIETYGMMCDLDDSRRVNILNLKKLEKLFTTEDGVDIFKGDSWFVFNDEYPKYDVYIGTESSLNLNNTFIRRFSNLEKAEEYMLMNKPCLSYNDVKEFFDNFEDLDVEFREYVKKIANAKK